MELQTDIVVDRPVQEVWDYLADLRNDPEWCRKVKSVEQLSGDGPGTGDRYRVMHAPRPLASPQELMVSVEEYTPPNRMRIREEDDDGVFDVTYELESLGEATRVTQRDRIDWNIPRRPTW